MARSTIRNPTKKVVGLATAESGRTKYVPFRQTCNIQAPLASKHCLYVSAIVLARNPSPLPDSNNFSRLSFSNRVRTQQPGKATKIWRSSHMASSRETEPIDEPITQSIYRTATYSQDTFGRPWKAPSSSSVSWLYSSSLFRFRGQAATGTKTPG